MKVTKKGQNNIKNKFIHNKNDQKSSKNTEQIEWFYMSPFEVNAKMIAEYAEEVNFGETEVWEELDILEIIRSDKSNIDFEIVRNNFKDENDMAFVKEREIKTIFTVTFSHCTIEDFKPFVQHLLKKWEGVFCADTYDFSPMFEKKDTE